MPSRRVINIPAAEPARLRKQRRGARWGGWLVRHLLLLLAQQRSPTERADWLLCSRSTGSAAAPAWPLGGRPWAPRSGSGSVPLPRSLTLNRRRSWLALRSKAPAVYGWCRTRWSCAARAETRRQRRGGPRSAETVRRWWHALDWRWKQAQLAAQRRGARTGFETGLQPPALGNVAGSTSPLVCR